MKFWVGVTDHKWFEFLQARSPDEVNFWQPSAKRRAAALEPGIPFLFKLHSPNNFIVGGGFYVSYSALPAMIAWDAFGEKNGVADYSVLRRRVEQYRREAVIGDPVIGCNVLNAPFFFSKADWIAIPPSWAPNIVQGRNFDTQEEEGSSLWRAVQHLMQNESITLPGTSEPRYGENYLTCARLGQGAFRVLVMDTYERRCAVTGERTLPVLEAAHIRPFSEDGPHVISNGLLLRSDLHTLFDRGYLTVTEDLRVEVSSRIREEFSNGREYYRHHGQPLQIASTKASERPAAEFLRWHNQHRYERWSNAPS